MFIRYLKCLFLFTTLLFILIFYVSKDLKHLDQLHKNMGERPAGQDHSTFPKTVVGMKDNRSGLPRSAECNQLFTVINHPPELLRLTAEEERTRSMMLPDITEPEAVALASENRFWPDSEKDGAAVDTHHRTLSQLSLVIFERVYTF